MSTDFFLDLNNAIFPYLLAILSSNTGMFWIWVFIFSILISMAGVRILEEFSFDFIDFIKIAMLVIIVLIGAVTLSIVETTPSTKEVYILGKIYFSFFMTSGVTIAIISGISWYIFNFKSRETRNVFGTAFLVLLSLISFIWIEDTRQNLTSYFESSYCVIEFRDKKDHTREILVCNELTSGGYPSSLDSDAPYFRSHVSKLSDLPSKYVIHGWSWFQDKSWKFQSTIYVVLLTLIGVISYYFIKIFLFLSIPIVTQYLDYRRVRRFSIALNTSKTSNSLNSENNSDKNIDEKIEALYTRVLKSRSKRKEIMIDLKPEIKKIIHEQIKREEEIEKANQIGEKFSNIVNLQRKKYQIIQKLIAENDAKLEHSALDEETKVSIRAMFLESLNKHLDLK